MSQEFTGKPHRAQRHADRVATWPSPRSASRAASTSPRPTIKTVEAPTRRGRNQAEVNQSGLFQSWDNFTFHPVVESHPLQKSARVTRVAQGAGGDDPYGNPHLVPAPRGGKRRSTLTVSAMAAGVSRAGFAKTPSPRRVTWRSSWSPRAGAHRKDARFLNEPSSTSYRRRRQRHGKNSDREKQLWLGGGLP